MPALAKVKLWGYVCACQGIQIESRMVSTQAIAEGDELVCHWGGGAPQSAAEVLAATPLPQRAEASKKHKKA